MPHTRIGFTNFAILCILLSVALPTAVWAGEVLDTANSAQLDWGLLPIFIGALFGGLTATFIVTDVDSYLKHATVAKMVIGSGLGFFTCYAWHDYAPGMSLVKLSLPAFALGSLGAPIMVFLLTWASNPDTRKKAGDELNRRLGLPSDKDTQP